MKSLTIAESGRRLVDALLADAEWDANTDAYTGFRAHITPERKQATRAPVGDANSKPTYIGARAEHKRYMADLARLDYEHKSGMLVEVEDVNREALRLARVVRDGLLNLPDRLAGELAAETSPFVIHRRLTEELRKALEDLSHA